MKFTANHAFMLAGSLCAAGSELIAQYAATGSPLPFHVTAVAALTLATALGAVSKSVLADKGAPAATVASDVLRAVAASLDAGGATSMHVAILDAVKQNVALLPPPMREVK